MARVAHMQSTRAIFGLRRHSEKTAARHITHSHMEYRHKKNLRNRRNPAFNAILNSTEE